MDYHKKEDYKVDQKVVVEENSFEEYNSAEFEEYNLVEFEE